MVLPPDVNLDEAPASLDLTRTLGVAGAKFARPVCAGQAERHSAAGAADYGGRSAGFWSTPGPSATAGRCSCSIRWPIAWLPTTRS